MIEVAARDEASMPSSVDRALLDRADRHPDAPYLAVPQDAGTDVELTYGEIAARARTVSDWLSKGGTGPGEHVILVLPNSAEFLTCFLGAMLCGAIPVPLSEPLHARMLGRFADYILHVARITEARRLLTSPTLASTLESSISEAGGTIAVSAIEGSAFDGPLPLRTLSTSKETTTAFVQFTSGSTSLPRGVVIGHDSVVANLERITQTFELDESSVVVSWLPLYHDMGMIGAALGALYAGGRLVLLTPLRFLMDPSCWLRSISDYGGTQSPVPNFALDLAVRKVPPEAREGLDLSSLKALIVGGEPNAPDTFRQFEETYAPFGLQQRAICPAYGLAEATLLVAASPPSATYRMTAFDRASLAERKVALVSAADDERLPLELTSCGMAIDDHEVVIVDDSMHPVPEDCEGEVVVVGPSVAGGYHGDTSATAETFPTIGGRRALRTGDLGFLHEGELYITGRLKDLVIVRGRNLHPEDIELALLGERSLPLALVAALGVPVNGNEELVIVAELRDDDPTTHDSIRDTVSRVVAREFAVTPYDVAFTNSSGVPRTSSGKIRRHACRERYVQGRFSGRHAQPAAAAASTDTSA